LSGKKPLWLTYGNSPSAESLSIFSLFIFSLDNLCSFLHIDCNRGGFVKRKALLKKLADAKFTFVDGGNHTKAYDASGRYRTSVGRHTEIPETTVRMIEKQTGVKLL
jgi:hypothetical protein